MRWAALWTLLLAAVLIPFALFAGRFDAIAERIARGDFSGWPAAVAVAGLLAIDVLLPVPSSVVSTAAGALFGFAAGTAVSWTGMTAGCALGYALGRLATGVARRLVGDASLDRASKLAARHGHWAIALTRPVPVLAEAGIVFAGIARAPAARSLAVAALANLVISVAWSALGAVSVGRW